MEQELRELVSRVFNIEAELVVDMSSPDNIERWDSLGHMNLVAAIEEEFDVVFDDDDIDALINFALIVNVVSEKLSKNA